ncbi:MAG: DUF4349 domain-containing protein [Candidatus Bathyarchaeia archaeon]
MKGKSLIILGVIVLLVFVSYFVGRLSVGLLQTVKYPGTSIVSNTSNKYSLAPGGPKDQSTSTEERQTYTGGGSISTTGYSQTASFGLKIIKNASLNMFVSKGKFIETYNLISSMIAPYGGNVTNSYYSKEEDEYSGYIQVIVPKDKFDTVINKLGELGTITDLKISSTDITQEYVDLNSRLKVLEAQKELLTSWLKQAKTIDELLKIRSEIENVESQIEQIKGRLNYIALNTDFSTVDIYLKEGIPPKTTTPSIFDKLKDYIKIPLNAFIYSLIGLLIIIAFLIPWGLIGYGVYYTLKKLRLKG